MDSMIRNARSAFAPILRPVRPCRGEQLLALEHRSRELYFVESGVLRSYHLVKDKDVTAHFAFEDGIVGAVDSIVYGRPSRYLVEALEDSQCLALSYDEMEAYLEHHPELERLARRITEHLYAELVERFEGMLFLSARERYEYLLARYPSITQRVGLGHLASYLGMTQETLSRVRGQRRF